MCVLPRGTLRSCTTSAFSCLGERRVVRDSLLPVWPRLQEDPDRETELSRVCGGRVTSSAFTGSGTVPVGLSPLCDDVRNKKLLGFCTLPAGGDDLEEDGVSSGHSSIKVFRSDTGLLVVHLNVGPTSRSRSTEPLTAAAG